MSAVDKLILGTAQIGLNYGINNQVGRPSFTNAAEILKEAYALGIRHLDTADAYGTASAVIRKYHESNPVFHITTKFQITDIDRTLVQKIKGSILQLGISSIDCYLYHSFSDFVAYPKVQNELVALKKDNLIRSIGLSIYTNHEFEVAIDSEIIDVIQLPFNLLDNFNKRGKLLQYAKQCNKKIQARSIFLQGLFFKNPDTFPIKLASLKGNVATLRDIARSKSISINALALNYVIWNPFIDFVLFGVDTIEQLKENIGAILPEFNSELFENIDAIDVKENELLYPMNWKC